MESSKPSHPMKLKNVRLIFIKQNPFSRSLKFILNASRLRNKFFISFEDKYNAISHTFTA